MSNSLVKSLSEAEQYVNTINPKLSCKVATNASGTLSSDFEAGDTIDDIVLSAGDRILIKDQGNGSENGIYVVNTTGAPTRSTDMDSSETCRPNSFVFIEEGTTNSDKMFQLTTDGDIIIDTTILTFEEYGIPGVKSITSGDGITGTDTTGDITLSLDLKTNGGLTIETSKLAVDLSASSITGTLSISDGGTGATTEAGARTNLGLSIGSDVQAYDSGLTSIAGLTTAADKMIYTTSSDTYAVTSLTSFARTLLDDTNASDARSTLGAGVGTVASVSGSGIVNGLSLSGTVTSSGSLTLGGTLTINNDDWSGTDLSVANGGTGASSFTSNAVLTGNGTSAIQSESNLTFDGSNLNVSGSISVSGHIIPNASSTYDLGSSSYNFRDLYLSGSTINLGGTKISTNNSGDIELMDTNDNPKKIMVDEIIIGTGTDRISLSKSNDKLKVGKRGTSGTGDIVPDTLDVSHGGTGHTTYNNGELLIGNGNNTLSKATLTQGDNISITNGSGSITISGNYSVGDGGLTQNNFTNILKSKLDGIADSANNYSLPISSSDTLGGIKVGNNLSIDVNGVLSSTDTNTTYSSGTGLTLNSNQFNIDSTVVTLTGLQILSNKTLTSPTLTTPILGTPQSGNLANCTFPTLNQDTSGSAGSVANALTAGTNISFSSGTTYDGSSPLVISVNDSFIKNSTDDTMIGTLTLSKISTTNTVLPALILQNSNLLSSGGIGLGVDMLFKIENSSGSIETTGGIRSTMIDPTNNTEDACLYFSTMSTGTYSTYLTLDGSTARINIGSTVNGIYLTKSTGSTINFGNNISLTHNSSGSTLDLTGASSGGFTCDGDITAFKTSDKRLKENIVRIGNPIEKIKKIGGYNFEWNKLGEEHTINKGNDIGVIAQEIEEILPEATTTRENGYKAVQYEKIVPLLIECIKDQQNMIENLQGQIDEIKSNII